MTVKHHYEKYCDMPSAIAGMDIRASQGWIVVAVFFDPSGMDFINQRIYVTYREEVK